MYTPHTSDEILRINKLFVFIVHIKMKQDKTGIDESSISIGKKNDEIQ